MKKIIICLTLLAVVFAPMLGAAEDEKKQNVKGKVEVGAKVVGGDGYVGKVKEYDSLDKGIAPVGKVEIKGFLNKLFFDLRSSYYGDPKDQNHSLNVDVARIVREKFSFDSFIHRLGNDPLTNLDVASEARSGVFHENFDPTKEYQITRSLISSETTLALPSVPFAKLYVNYRNEMRQGHYQARTLSKCSSCHIVAKTRDIENSAQDYQLGGNIRAGNASFDYSFTQRQFKENQAAPTNTYLQKLHPEKVIPVFNSRIQYDSADGALPFDIIPDTDKQTHLVKANIPLFNSTTVSAQYSNSTVDNNFNNLQIQSNALAGGISTRVGKLGLFNARVNYISIDNDSVLVDIIEPVDIAGPLVGQTFVEAYPDFGSADWTRNSALSRKTLDFNANFKYKVFKKANLRLDYEYKKIEREFYDVEITKRSTFRGTFDFKPSKAWKLKVSGRLQSTEQPFTNLFAAVAPSIQLTGTTNPFITNQFYVFHQSREANLTNVPTNLSEIKGFLSWSPSYKVSFTGNVMYRSEKNDELNYSDWGKDLFNFGLNVWVAPLDKVDISVSYYSYGESLNSLFSLPVLEGCGGGIIGGFPGTLIDMVNYDVDTQTAFLNTNIYASEKLSFYGNLTYNNSQAVMSDLTMDPSQVSMIPGSAATALDFTDFGEVAEYSDLSMKQIMGEAGVLFNLSGGWGVKGAAFYYFYDDLAPYLYDTEGKTFNFYLSVIWNF